MMWRITQIQEGAFRRSRMLKADNTLQEIISSYHTKAEFNNIHSKYFQGQLKIINWMILKLMNIIFLKSAKIKLSVFVAAGKFICDVKGGKPISSLFVFIQNCQVTKSFLVHLWTEPSFQSPDSRKGSFTSCNARRIYENQLTTSFIIFRSGLGGSQLILSIYLRVCLCW